MKTPFHESLGKKINIISRCYLEDIWIQGGKLWSCVKHKKEEETGKLCSSSPISDTFKEVEVMGYDFQQTHCGQDGKEPLQVPPNHFPAPVMAQAVVL